MAVVLLEQVAQVELVVGAKALTRHLILLLLAQPIRVVAVVAVTVRGLARLADLGLFMCDGR